MSGELWKSWLRPVGAVVVAFLVWGAALPVHAQDSHYWTDQFGNRAMLLSGAVVGDAADVSAVYYNPGALSLIEQTELLLAGLALSVSRASLDDAVAGEDLGQTTFDVVPSLIGGEIPVEGKHRFAYSLLKRHSGEFRATTSVNLDGGILDEPIVALLGNSMRIDSRLSEYWAGGTWSYPVTPTIGFGVSTFFAARSQRRYATNTVQLLSTNNRAILANVTNDYSYYHWRLLWKIGVQASVRNWDLGLTVTTPSIPLFGDGRVNNNYSVVGQIVDDDGNFLTAIASDSQKSLSTDYRSPLSIAIGAARSFGPNIVHFTAEYFAPVDAYTVIDAEPFEGQSFGEVIDPSIFEELDDVLNVAIGLERAINENLYGYFGFHTDFNSSSNEATRANLSHTKWNYYHVSGGATISAGGRSFTLGGNLALASDTVSVDPQDPFRPIGLPPEVEASSYRLTVLLGFSFLSF